jgi:hypothetical protein
MRRGSSSHLVRSPSLMRLANWPEPTPDAHLIMNSHLGSVLVGAKTRLARGLLFRGASGIPIMPPNGSRWRIHKKVNTGSRK